MGRLVFKNSVLSTYAVKYSPIIHVIFLAMWILFSVVIKCTVETVLKLEIICFSFLITFFCHFLKTYVTMSC